MAYIQKNNPFPITSCGRRRTFTQGGAPGSDRHKTNRLGNSPIKQKKVNTEQTKPETSKIAEDYTYKLVDANGKVVKDISKEEYIKYKNEPGTDKPTKTTTNPDVYGRKKGGSPSNPKNK